MTMHASRQAEPVNAHGKLIPLVKMVFEIYTGIKLISNFFLIVACYHVWLHAESWNEPNNKARVLNERIQDIHSKRSGVDNHGNKAHHEKHAVDDCTLPNIAENVDAWWIEEFQLTSVRLL